MGRLIVLGPMCLCSIGVIVASPAKWLSVCGMIVLGLIVVLWAVLAWLERQLNDAVDVSAQINFRLTKKARAVLVNEGIIEEDRRFEQNSGIKRWRLP